MSISKKKCNHQVYLFDKRGVLLSIIKIGKNRKRKGGYLVEELFEVLVFVNVIEFGLNM
jgi:hypothetical protein